MPVLNLINPERSDIKYKTMVFPDGQPHIALDPLSIPDPSSTVEIICRISNSNHLLLVLFAKNALDITGIEKIFLNISYLMGARMDRVMSNGEPFSLKIIAEILNTANFNRVNIFDPHSEVSTAVIDRSYAISNQVFVKECIEEHMGNNKNYFIVSPDGGALKKIHQVGEYIGAENVGECMKTRDVKTGKLSGFRSMVDDYQKMPCFIVDDICDGGGTFSGVGKVLKEKNAGEVILIVSHGIFSKGYTIENIDKIYTTNSYKEIESDEIVIKPVERYL